MAEWGPERASEDSQRTFSAEPQVNRVFAGVRQQCSDDGRRKPGGREGGGRRGENGEEERRQRREEEGNGNWRSTDRINSRRNGAFGVTFVGLAAVPSGSVVWRECDRGIGIRGFGAPLYPRSPLPCLDSSFFPLHFPVPLFFL